MAHHGAALPPAGVMTRKRKREVMERESPPASRTRSRTNIGNHIITWNMEGQGGKKTDIKRIRLRKMLNDEQNRVICLQECGDPATLPEESGWTRVDYPWGVAQDVSRCSMAMYIRGEVVSQTSRPAVQDHHRGFMGATISVAGRLLDVFNIHAPSAMNLNTAQSIEDTIHFATLTSRPFMIVGDHNQFPNTTSQGAIFQQHDLQVSAPTIPTRPVSGRIYDYYTHDPRIEISSPQPIYYDSDHTTVDAVFQFGQEDEGD